MNITFTASPLPKPEDMSVKARLAWDYFQFNNGGWMVSMSSCGSVIVTDEAGNISESGICFGDMVCFLDWLEETADEHIKDGNTNFLSAWINPALLNTEVAEAAFKILSAVEVQEPKLSPYDELRYDEFSGCHTIEVEETATGKTGVARSVPGGVDVCFGADDGSDDGVVSVDYFNRRFVITAAIKC